MGNGYMSAWAGLWIGLGLMIGLDQLGLHLGNAIGRFADAINAVIFANLESKDKPGDKESWQ